MHHQTIRNALAGGTLAAGSQLWRPCAMAALVAGALGTLTAPAAVHAQQTSQQARSVWNIPAQPLVDALRSFASQGQQQLLFDEDRLEPLRSNGVNGSYTAQEALNQLLAGTGIVAVQSSPGFFTLRDAPHASSSEVGVLPELVVTAQQPSAVSEGSETYAAQAVSIGRVEQTLREIPQSVSVLTRQRLDDQNLHSMEQALGHTPGITVNAAAAGMLYDFYSRGFPIQNVSFDGVQMLTGWGGFDAQPDTATIDRIEVLRGADGLYSGAGQPGGTVNLGRKRPLDHPQLSANLALGSWANKRGEFDVTGPLNAAGTLRGRGVLAWQHKDFFFDSPAADKRVAYGVLEADIGPKTAVGLGLSYQKADSPMETGHPRAVDGSDLGLSRRRSFTSNWNFYNFETTQVFADLKHKFPNDWTLRVNASTLKETSVFKDAYVRGSYDPVTQSGLTIAGNAGRYESKQHGIDLSLDGYFKLFSHTHAFGLGANYIERDSPSFTKVDWSLPEVGMSVPLAFDPNLIPEPAMPRMDKTANAHTRQSGIYGVVRWSLTDDLVFASGARATWYDYKSKNLTTGNITSKYSQDAEITPYAALIWRLHPNYSLYASYTDIFRVQSSLYQADGTPLDPAVGANYEIGIKGSSADGRLNGSFAIFQIDESNRSQLDPSFNVSCLGNPSGGPCYINAGKVRSRGLEAELNGEITYGWHWFAGYTYNTTEYLRDRTGDGSPSANEGQSFRTVAPRHMLRAYTKYQLPGEFNRWAVSGGINLQSETRTGIARQSGYAIWNAAIGYQLNKNVALNLSVNNFFDKVYYRRVNTREGNMYGDPRNFMLTARVKF